MEDSEDNIMTTEDVKSVDNPTTVRVKPKKRSIVERELETNLTARITSPLTNRDRTSTSRYGRARRLKIETEVSDLKKVIPDVLKSNQNEKSPVKAQSPVYKMHASNSPMKMESPKRQIEAFVAQGQNSQQENISVNCFDSDDISPENRLPKIFVRKDIMKSKDTKLGKNVFSPKKSQKINSHLNNLLERTSANFNMNKSKDYIENLSVVKTLDFDSKKKKKENKESKSNINTVKENKTAPKNEVFDLEAQCLYQVGDLAWARMGTYPFWPSIITRDPLSGLFVKKKLFGRVERNIIHVTFFGDNGRRSWIVENMLRRFMGLAEFQMTKEQFTSEDKKKDPKLYSSFSISEKKQPLWMTSVEEAEMLLREPKRLRIDLLNEMLVRSRTSKHLPKGHKSGKISRADSDVSLSESLYDTLFSEDDGKPDEDGNNSRKKSLDVSEVVTACLDNMAAKTGITKIQKQSHMDRWLQKAKSKTPEKTQVKALVSVNLVENKMKNDSSSKKNKQHIADETVSKSYSLRKSNESQNFSESHSEHDYSKFVSDDESPEEGIGKSEKFEYISLDESGSGIGFIAKVESLADENLDGNYCENSNESSENAKSVVDTVPKSNGIENDKPISESKPVSYDSSVQLDSCNEKSDSEKLNDSSKKSKLYISNGGSSEENNAHNHKSMNTDSKEYCVKNISVVNDNESVTNNNIDKSTIYSVREEEEARSDCLKNCVDSTNADNEDIYSDEVSSVESLVWSPLTVAGNSDTEKDMLEDDIFTKDFEDNQELNYKRDVKETDLEKSDIKSIAEQSKHFIVSMNMDKTMNTEDKISDDSNNLHAQATIKNNISEIGQRTEAVNHETEENHVNEKTMQNENATPNLITSTGGIVTEISITKDSDLDSIKNSESEDEHHVKVRGVVKKSSSSPNASTNKNPLNKVSSTKVTTSESSINSNCLNSENKNVQSINSVTSTTKKMPEENRRKGDESQQLTNGHMDNPEVDETKSGRNKENRAYKDVEIPGFDVEGESIDSEDSEIVVNKIKSKLPLKQKKTTLKDPEFLKYLEMKQDAVMDEHPELNEMQIVEYLHNTWLYEKNNETKKANDLDHPNFVKGLEEGIRKKVNRANRVSKDSNKNRSRNVEYVAAGEDIASIYSDERSRSPIISMDKQEEMLRTRQKTNADSTKSDSKKEVASKISEEKTSDQLTEKVQSSTETKQNSKEIQSSLSRLRLKINGSSPMKSPRRVDSQTGDENVDKNSPLQKMKEELELETTSIDSESSDAPLIYRKLRQRNAKESKSPDLKKAADNYETISIESGDSDVALIKRKQKIKNDKNDKNSDDPEFLKYLELRQDALIDENPQLTEEEIKNYLYKTWIYEENSKHELKKSDDIEQSVLIKGLNDDVVRPKKIKKQIKVNKHHITDYFEVREKSKRKSIKPYYNEEYSDDSTESFETNFNNNVDKNDNSRSDSSPIKSLKYDSKTKTEYDGSEDEFTKYQSYFDDLLRPKPNVFKGMIREKVCDICENAGRLVKCRGCNAMFHVDCTKKQAENIEMTGPTRGRKKKKKVGRKPKNSDDFENISDDKINDISEENVSMEEIEMEPLVVDAELFEREMKVKMKELLDSNEEIQYDCYSNEDSILWANSIAGRCEIVDVQLKRRDSAKEPDYSDFKCNNCQKYDTPICFVCKLAVTKNDSSLRQRCHVGHCHKYYHLECLEHWPQTQLSSGEPSMKNKRVNEHFETLTCPRHVCHTCVSDDPRGCKTRFSGDKLARCVRCPATYHSFTKCIPAGSQILNASHIICPRHYEHRPGKVSCHVNTGWCFICALGGSLICCEYCPTSFHAECLNIDPPEGGYMCEDCETGLLPLYGEMVWVKLGHYRWWPGIILHPSEIPENIMAVKHSHGEFVVRFFGQYDHYWVNRGRVFPFQEGDSGRVSSQKSKIDAAFTTAMEHAQRACEILKSAQQNDEESSDIASSLLPPHYVKLKVNKPCGSLCGWKLDDPELSLTQCECDPTNEDPCGPYSQCLNRMLLTECGPTCRTGERCNNRAFEKRQYPKLVPYRTPQRGWGLKTLEDIKAGQFVIEYVGELIDEEEFRRRMRRKHEIRDENFYFLTLDKERMIDAGPKGNLARFMNHCCEPNCETQKWTVLGDIRVGLFAINDIPAHSEVTFNYNLESAGIEKKRCMCGAKRCSGYIGAKPKQDESLLKKPKRPYKKRKIEESPSTKVKPKRPLGRPPKPKELTEIEKDLLIIKNATNDISSDDSNKHSSEGDRPKAMKRRRVSFNNEDSVSVDGEMQSKKSKSD